MKAQARSTTSTVSGAPSSAALTPDFGSNEAAQEQLRGVEPEVDGGLLAALPSQLVVVDAEDATEPEDLSGWTEALRYLFEEMWGVPFEPSRLSFQDGAVVLDWSEAWGPHPDSDVLHGDFVPVEARLSVIAVRALAGWGLLDASVQRRLETALGLSHNALSEAIRIDLQNTLAELRSLSPEDQAARLDTLNGGEMRGLHPSDADGVEAMECAPYELVGPQEDAAHAFRGITADAERWEVRFEDEVGGQVEVFAPKAPTADGLQQVSVETAANAISRLPTPNRQLIDRITLAPIPNPDDAYWAVAYNMPGFTSFMTAGAGGELTVYPVADLRDEDYLVPMLLHETGHTWSRRRWGDDITADSWKPWFVAMDSDGLSVSTYADASVHEDVAETVSVYGSTMGTPAHDEYRAMVPARFDIIDDELMT